MLMIFSLDQNNPLGPAQFSNASFVTPLTEANEIARRQPLLKPNIGRHLDNMACRDFGFILDSEKAIENGVAICERVIVFFILFPANTTNGLRTYFPYLQAFYFPH